MKLLPKSDIQLKKSMVQKQTIDEGKKLAKRIDSLREVVALEEASLDKFRSETLIQIHKETTEAGNKRDQLLGEVRELELAKKEATSPLTRQWEELEEAKKKLSEKTIALEKKELELEKEKIAVLEVDKQVSDALARAKTIEDESRNRIEIAIEKESQAKATLLQAQEMEATSREIKAKLASELVHREQQCSERENGIIMIEERLRARESEMVKEQVRLEDRRQTLERAFNRLKK